MEVSVDNWWLNCNSISLFVSGKTGTGKSTLVNALLGEKLAKVGYTFSPETSEVKSFTRKIQEIDVTVWDSPGLEDGTKNEDKYLKDIRNKCNGKIDLFLYCISMSTMRFMSGSPDMESMIKLTKALGPEIWENAVVVLTCANIEIRSMKKMLPNPERVEAKFNERLEEWRLIIVNYLQEDVMLSAETAQNIKILPAGRIELPFLLEGHCHWLSQLYTGSLAATKMRAQPAFIKMNMNRLMRSSDVWKEDDIEDLLRKLKIIIHNKAIEVSKKMWFFNEKRANVAAQVISRRITQSFKAQNCPRYT